MDGNCALTLCYIKTSIHIHKMTMMLLTSWYGLVHENRKASGSDDFSIIVKSHHQIAEVLAERECLNDGNISTGRLFD